MTTILKPVTIVLLFFVFVLGCKKNDEAPILGKKEIKSFVFEAKNNGEVLTADVDGDISETTIVVALPFGTDLSTVSLLTPTIEVSDKASVSPKSGEAQDFTDPKTYRVTAENGSTQDYTVTVITRSAPSFNVLSYYEEDNRIGAGDFEKPDLFEISDIIVDGGYPYSLRVADKEAGSGTLEVTDGKATIGSKLSITDWNSIDDEAITIELTIADGEFSYSTTKEQYKIRSWQDLQGMKYDLEGDYTLENDISLPDPSTTGGVFPKELPAAGFDPVGDGNNTFTGSFEGQDNVIKNFFIDRENKDYVGLFGYAEDVTIGNVGIEVSANGVKGNDHVGGLVGSVHRSVISASYATGGDVTGNNRVGGLVGDSYSGTTISTSSATCSVVGTENSVGGMVGRIEKSTIAESSATGSVTGNWYIGGLVGHIYKSTIRSSHATGSVTGNGRVGGLVGDDYSHSTITESYATGNVEGIGDYVGGLVGRAERIDITKSYATGSVTGTGINAGGLVGDIFQSTITKSYATGSVTGGSTLSGLVGRSIENTITESYATGSVTGDGRIAGLVGYSKEGTITNSYATGSVEGNNRVGGLVAASYRSTITNSYATGLIKAGDDRVGGLLGVANGDEITNSYWDVASTGKNSSAGGVQVVGVSSGSNLKKVGENSYVDEGKGDSPVFVDWGFGTDDNNPWKWLGNSKWPILHWAD